MMTPSSQETNWLEQIRDWLKQRPLWAIVVEVDAETGRVRHVRSETVENAAAILDGLQMQENNKEE